jgi:hypothetical protein
MTTRRAFALAVVALSAFALALGGAGCKKRRLATYAYVTIVARTGYVIDGIAQFRSTVSNAGETDVETFDVPGGSINLGAGATPSETYTLDLRGRMGLVDVYVEAIDATGASIANGMVTTTVAPNANWSIAVELSPTGTGTTDAGGSDGSLGLDGMVPLTCGDGVVDPGEQCDDGDMDPNDFCDNCSLTAVPAATAATLQAAEPRVAMRASGEILLVWTDISGVYHDVFARRFDAEGLPLDAAEVRVNANQPPNDEKPDLALDRATGDFVVVWHTCPDAAPTGCDVVARLFAWDLTPQMNASGTTDEFVVNLADGEDHIRPSVALTASGFVVAWQQSASGVQARLFDATGAPVMDPFGAGTDPFDVPEVADAASCSPDVATGSDDRFVVVWGSACDATFGATDVTGRLFPNAGAPGAEFTMPVANAGPYRTPVVAMAPGSSPANAFLVVWESAAAGDSAIEAAAFNGNGMQQAFVDVAGPSDPGIDRRDPAVGYNPGDGATGHFLVGWRETSGTGGLTSLGLHARLVHPTGTTVATSFVVEAGLVAGGDTPSPRVLDYAGAATGFWTAAWRTPTGVSFRLFPAGFRP